MAGFPLQEFFMGLSMDLVTQMLFIMFLKEIYNFRLMDKQLIKFSIACLVIQFLIWIFFRRQSDFIIKTIVMIIAYILLQKAILKMYIFPKGILCTGIFMALLIISNFFAFFVFNFLNIDANLIKTDLVINLISSLIIAIVVVIAILIIKYFRFQSINGIMKSGYRHIYLLGIVNIFAMSLLCGIVLQITVILTTDKEKVMPYVPAFLFISLLFMHFTMISLRFIQKDESRRIELDEKKKELVHQRFYCDNLEFIISDLKTIRHGFDNTMSCIGGYVKMEKWYELKTYINDILVKKNNMDLLDNIISKKLMNPGIIGLLANKFQYARQRQVDMRIMVKDEVKEVNMCITDLCEILGILIDNAIEAASISTKKYVYFTVTNNCGKTIFKIENSVNEKPDVVKMFEKGYSTKGNDRGIGLSIIKDILKTYNNVTLNTIAESEFIIQELITC